MKLLLHLTLILLAVIISQSSAAQFRVNKNDVKVLKEKLRPLIQNAKDADGRMYLVPAIVRLAFHGCIGRCDGCININHPFNKGLNVPVEALEPLMKEWPGSRADLWAIAYEVAKDLGLENNNKRCAQKYPLATKRIYYDRCRTKPWYFQHTYIGRIDCDAGGPYYDKELNYPNVNMDKEAMRKWFWDELKVQPYHIIALMGAHSAAKVEIDGVNRTYIPGESDGLSFRYFSNIINLHCDRKWEQKLNSEGTQYYWNGKNQEFAFPMDISLVREFNSHGGKFNTTNGFSSKRYHELRKSGHSMEHTVYRYATQKSNWSVDFMWLMQHVLGHGYRLDKH